jgi:N-methylhydantoinase A
MFKIGIDVGGTFTDIVVQDAEMRLHHGKVPSQPGNESAAVIAALELMAGRLGEPLRAFLGRTSSINFGTTVATNAMLQDKGVPTAMLTTRGFRDIVEIRRGHKEVLFDIRLPAPRQIVRREWRLPITERIGPDGKAIEALAEHEVEAAAKRINDGGIKSVAICFLNSYLNAAHERRAAEILQKLCPGVDLHLSSEILPKIREFERFSTTIVNAFLSPLLRDYLDRLMRELRTNGFERQLFVMQSNGGTVAPELAGRFACGALFSGPAAGVAAAVRVGAACGAGNIIGVDMGGTSYDVSLIRNGAPETRNEAWFNRQFVGVPMLEMHTIGAGGGSIAWIDDGGALRVGPQSAGAHPGPACYGRGGEVPTTTDVFLHLGYLNPDFFLGGRMRLDPALAENAIKRIAGHFGVSNDDAAFSIFRIINNHLSNGIRYVSVSEGHDPRDFTLMSFGGAGSLTVCLQARDLGIGKVLVPRMASVFCALGELMADLRVSQLYPQNGNLAVIDAAALEQALDRLAEPVRADLSRHSDVQSVRVERHAELRYAGQVHELSTTLGDGSGTSLDLAEVANAFHLLHKQRYAFDMPSKPVEILAVRQDVVGTRAWEIPTFHELADPNAQGAIKERRKVGFPNGNELSWIDTPIYDGSLLRPGHQIAGPAIIEEVDTTIVILPTDRLRLNKYDVYEITIGEA